jgi:hypothetical protein
MADCLPVHQPTDCRRAGWQMLFKNNFKNSIALKLYFERKSLSELTMMIYLLLQF